MRHSWRETIRKVETIVHNFERRHERITPKRMIQELDKLEQKMEAK